MMAETFENKIQEISPDGLRPHGILALQANLCRACNMCCTHCHLDANGHRTEMMDQRIMDRVLSALSDHGIGTLDITGGAPELNPRFRYFVGSARKRGVHVIVRSNLTVFFEPHMADLPAFYKEQTVEVTASLPHFRAENTDRIRGTGSGEKSLQALRMLNRMGYGSDPVLQLNLVYNPPGTSLPLPQALLEKEYRDKLAEQHDIIFNRLYIFNNSPVGRFRSFLDQTGSYDNYLDTLRTAYNPAAIEGLMCRTLLSVRWDGSLFDCDFNLALGDSRNSLVQGHIDSFSPGELRRRRIQTGDHCFACTAAQGST